MIGNYFRNLSGAAREFRTNSAARMCSCPLRVVTHSIINNPYLYKNAQLLNRQTPNTIPRSVKTNKSPIWAPEVGIAKQSCGGKPHPHTELHPKNQ